MAQKPNLTPERKSQLRQKVLTGIAAKEKVNIIEPKKRFKKTADLTTSKITGVKAEKTDNDQGKEIKKSEIKKKIEQPKSVPAGHLLAAPKKHHLWLKILFLISGALLLFIFINLVGIYQFGWQGDWSIKFARAFNLPAGSVNGQWLKITDYLEDIKLLKVAIDEGREGIDGQLVDYRDLEDKIFWRLAANQLVNQELAKYHIKITDQLIELELQNLINEVGSRRQTEEAILNIYHLNLNQFKEKVLKPLVARRELLTVLMTKEDLPINLAAKEKAEEALILAQQPGVDFPALVKQFSDDYDTINVGGDLGWFIEERIDQGLASALFNLPPDSVYSEVVRQAEGYHVIKVEDKLINPDDGRLSIRLSHILVAVDIDEYIKELMDQAKIKRYLR